MLEEYDLVFFILGFILMSDVFFSIGTHTEEKAIHQSLRFARLLVAFLLMFNQYIKVSGLVILIMGYFLIGDALISIATHKEEKKLYHYGRGIRLLIGIILILISIPIPI